MVNLIKTISKILFMTALYSSIFGYLTNAVVVVVDLVDYNLLPKELLLAVACAGSTIKWILSEPLFDLMLDMIVAWPVFKIFSYISYKVFSL